jgi:hypothetical protein
MGANRGSIARWTTEQPHLRLRILEGRGTESMRLPFNKMQPTGRLDNATHLAGLERKCSLLKLLLHVSLAKVPKIPPLAGAAAVALGHGQLTQGSLAALDAGLVLLDNDHGVILAAGNLALAPRGGPPAVAVLHQEVGGADLAIGLLDGGTGVGRRVVCGHELLELLRVGAGRRLPARDFLLAVEVVGQVLGVAVAHFPARGESGLILCDNRQLYPRGTEGKMCVWPSGFFGALQSRNEESGLGCNRERRARALSPVVYVCTSADIPSLSV